MRQPLLVPSVVLLLLACAGTQPAGTQPDNPPPMQAEGSQGGPAPAAPAETSPVPSTTLPAAEGASNDEPPASNEFQLQDSKTARDAHGASPSKIKPSTSEAAMKFIVIDKDKGPVEGIVVKLTAPDGKTYYTEETDAVGYAEVLVPIGTRYDLTYLSLGRQDIQAKVPVSNEPNQNIKLTLRYKRDSYPTGEAAAGPPRFVLKGVTFDTARATIRPESHPRLELVVEYMTHKKNAQIEISGHTDSVGNPRANKTLSEQRAQAVAAYLAKKGVDRSRIKSIGHGADRPIASNDTEEGRQENRRIEVTEID